MFVSRCMQCCMQWLEGEHLPLNQLRSHCADQRDAMITALSTCCALKVMTRRQRAAFCAFLSGLQPASLQRVWPHLLHSIRENFCEEHAASMISHGSVLPGHSPTCCTSRQSCPCNTIRLSFLTKSPDSCWPQTVLIRAIIKGFHFSGVHSSSCNITRTMPTSCNSAHKAKTNSAGVI